MAQAIIYLCESPKSNSVLLGITRAMADAKEDMDTPVPIHLRDTHYQSADKLGNGVGYKYPHDYPGHYIEQQYGPDSIKGKIYYSPSDMGNEAKISEAMKRRKKKK